MDKKECSKKKCKYWITSEETWDKFKIIIPKDDCCCYDNDCYRDKPDLYEPKTKKDNLDDETKHKLIEKIKELGKEGDL